MHELSAKELIMRIPLLKNIEHGIISFHFVFIEVE